MSALPVKKETDNIIQLRVVDGKISKKEKVRYNKDGTIDKRHSNAVAGQSTMVYPFYEDEIKNMIELFNKRIEEADTNSHRQIASRNKMLFIVSINIALRVSDLVVLKWRFFLNDDMTFKKTYKIQPKKTKKTGKFVPLYFNESVQKSILEYINQYPIEDMDDYLFKSRKGDGHITEASLGRIIKEAANEIGITKNICSHSLRKTFGYHVWHSSEDKKKSLIMLMYIFNHSSITTTEKYIGIMDEEIESVFNDLNLGIDLF